MNTEACSSRRERFAFYLDPEQRLELERRSAASGAPKAELLRRALKSWLSPESALMVKSTNGQNK